MMQKKKQIRKKKTQIWLAILLTFLFPSSHLDSFPSSSVPFLLTTLACPSVRTKAHKNIYTFLICISVSPSSFLFANYHLLLLLFLSYLPWRYIILFLCSLFSLSLYLSIYLSIYLSYIWHKATQHPWAPTTTHPGLPFPVSVRARNSTAEDYFCEGDGAQ